MSVLPFGVVLPFERIASFISRFNTASFLNFVVPRKHGKFKQSQKEDQQFLQNTAIVHGDPELVNNC